jgi:pyrroline-5-carboxylate reductase
MTASDPSIELMRLINGYQVSQALHVAATLGVADQLKDGPKAYDAVTQACGAHPASLYRLLRALAAVGVFREGLPKGSPRAIACQRDPLKCRCARRKILGRYRSG